jgi:DNA-binding CsgD family transcriptional regulator
MDLLERESHLAALARAFAEAREGNGRIALVSGEAGIGKTSLVRRFAAEITPPTRLLWGACDALFTPRPLGPLYDLAPQTAPALTTQLNEGADWLTIARTFLSDLQRKTAVVVIEDVHWADAATLDLLKFLGRRIGQTNSLLTLTFRDDELHAQHPLQILLGDLATTGLLQRIPLYGLSVDAVSALSGDKGIDAATLHRQTNGNPFFVTEVLASEVATGVDSDIPATVRDAVLARAARLSLSARAVLEAAAVIGARVEPWLLAEVTGAEATAVTDCLAAGVLQTEGDFLSFRHELARQVILDATSPSQRLALHRLVLLALQASPLTQSDLARLAHHAEAAGDYAAVLEYAPAAAQQAMSLGAHREAAAHYQTALRFAGQLPATGRADLLAIRSYTCYLTGQIEAAIQARQEALAIWQQLSQPLAEGDSLRWLSRLNWFAGHVAEARRYAQAAIDVLKPLPAGPELASAYSNYAQLYMLAEDNHEAIRWGERAIGLANQLGATNILAHALNNVGTAELHNGNKAGWLKLEQSLQLSLDHGLREHAARAYTNIGCIAVTFRDYARAMNRLHAGIEYATEYELDSWSLYMRGWLARAHFEQGQWDSADETAQVVINSLNANYAAAVLRLPALTTLGHLRARRGDPGSWALLDEAYALAQETGEFQRVGPVAWARAEAAWLAGNIEQARLEAEAGFRLAQAHPANIWSLSELAFWLWRANALAEQPVQLAPPYGLHMAGNWPAAALAWEQLGCPYEQAGALADGDAAAQLQALAIYEELGATPAATALRQKLHQAGVAGIPRGPRPATQQNPHGLTPRQMEVLLLLAKGLSNTDIADHLTISPHTVEHHVTAVLAKLNVNSRQEAAAVAWEHDLLTDR